MNDWMILNFLPINFLDDIAEEYGAKKKIIQTAAVEALEKHQWTGNIRELRNVIERLVYYEQ